MARRRQHIRNTRAVLEAGTMLDGEYAWDQTLKTIRGGDGATLGGYLLGRWGYGFPVSPAQITANQNNYSPTDLAVAEALFVNGDAARTITGLALGASGRRLTVINRGGFDITLANNSASSTAANRFLFEADVVLRPNAAIELQYSATDSRWMRMSGGAKFSTIVQELLLAGVISPAQITANQNDYAPAGLATATTLRISTDATRNITGMVDAREGTIKTIINVGSNPIVLKNADAGSTAANRFDFGADITLAGKQSATLRYDATDSRWKLLSATAGASVAAGAVTAQTLSASAMGMSMINGTLVASVAGGALTVAVKTLAGTDPSAADPVFFIFRNATIGLGDYVVRTVTAAMSLVISSGSSMGFTNNVPGRLWLLAIDTGAGVVLGAVNCLSANLDIYPLAGFGLISTTAEGGAGAADSNWTIYSAAAQVSKPYGVLGYASFEAGLAAAGTWNVTPSRLQLHQPGMPLPGALLQRDRFDASFVATGSTVLPIDDTIPQNTEGDQFLSLPILPISAANIARVRARLMVSASALTGSGAALFRDSVANAISGVSQTAIAAGYHYSLSLDHSVVFGAASATTFKVRAGMGVAGTMTLNGASAARIFGGVMNSYIEVEELMS